MGPAHWTHATTPNSCSDRIFDYYHIFVQISAANYEILADFDKFIQIFTTCVEVSPRTPIIACLYYIHYFSHKLQNIK